jgi:hypothetical protein
LRGSFVLVGSVAAFLLFLSASFVVLGERRRRALGHPAPDGAA